MACIFRRSNGTFYLVATRKGKRIWRSTGETNLERALEAARSQFPDLLIKSRRLTLNEFAALYFPYAEANFAPSTVTLYRGGLKAFRRLTGDKALESFKPHDMEQFKILRLKEVSPSKVNIDLTFLKAFFQMAVTWKHLEQNPCFGVKRLRVPVRRHCFITKPEFQRLLDVIPDRWYRELIAFAVSTMMRAGEIVNLTWESIDLERRVIMVENTKEHRLKTQKPHAVPINNVVFEILLSRQQRSGHVFLSPDGQRLTVDHVGKKFKRHVREAGLSEDYHFHTLRHTGASWLVQGGVSLYAVQRLLGHSNVDVTTMYSHLVTGDMQDAVNKISVGNGS